MIIKVRRGLHVGEYSELLKVADYVGTSKTGEYLLFRLNLLKASRIPLYESQRILAKYGFPLKYELISKIKQLKDYELRIYLYRRYLTFEYLNEAPLRHLELLELVRYDDNIRAYVSYPSHLWKIVEELRKLDVKFKVDIKYNFKLSLYVHETFKLRDYQHEAFLSWLDKGCKGIVVLPVAAGKTYIAYKAISNLKVKTLILVPTIDLISQWVEGLSKNLGLNKEDIGVLGGGRKEIKEITVSTYDSAYLNIDSIMLNFGLIVADECHHAVSEKFREIFYFNIAPYRLGLTATPIRQDELHRLYPAIIGPIVYTKTSEELQRRGYLAKHREERIFVDLTWNELKEYNKLMQKYEEYCNRVIPNIKDPLERFRKVVELAYKDPEAKEALKARLKARQIALNAERKIKVLEKLLKKYADEKVIIFSRYTDIIREISKRFFIPKILHDTPKEERNVILKLFKEGKITKIATAMALDEGVDVPDASVAIIISGTGSSREYIQRLGRILRPKDKEAKLIELITRKTLDVYLSERRRRRISLEDYFL